MKGYYMNVRLDRIADEGYEPTGIPGLIIGKTSIQSYGNHEIIKGLAKKSIESSNPKELDYIGCAIFTEEFDKREGEKNLVEIVCKEKAYLAVVIPLRER